MTETTTRADRLSVHDLADARDRQRGIQRQMPIEVVGVARRVRPWQP